ncbi:hypothetical protein XELAEV_18024610mg [Xenopus laevis]|uniref:Protein kinase domain-containing protein n=1 Tax=Xenopus laevis TaxID=8355 RepID=A0A974CZ96_XENLA|nr:hypothetical protein XELAEV_18024610mg [Xenopus laevis]
MATQQLVYINYSRVSEANTPVVLVQIEMEFCGGGTLSELIDNPLNRGLPEPFIAYICRKVLKGLSHLHKNKIMHQDIKALNIAITEDTGIHLNGCIGYHCKNCYYKTLTKTMAPFDHVKPWPGQILAMCDIWALGITDIQMAEARCPFNSFIEVCLTKNPKDRPTAAFLLQNHPFIADIQDEMQVIAELKDLVRRQEERARIESIEKISEMPDKNTRSNDVDLASKPAEDIPSAAVEEVPSDVVVSLDTKIEETAENAEDEELASKPAEDIPNTAVEEVNSDVVVSLDTKIEKTAENAEETASEIQVDEPASEVVEAILPQDVGSTDIEEKQDTIYHINIGESEKDIEGSTTPMEDHFSPVKEPQNFPQELSPQEEVGSTDTEEEQTTVCHIDMGDSEEAPHSCWHSIIIQGHEAFCKMFFYIGKYGKE